MKALHRAAYVAIVAVLAAAIPVSAAASEDFLKTNVSQSEAQFNQALAQAISDGLNPVAADQLSWRFSQISSVKPSSWWQTPVVQHSQLSELSQLQSDLESAYQADISERREGLLRQIRRFELLFQEVEDSGVNLDSQSDVRDTFLRYAQLASTPNDLSGVSQVLAAQTDILNGHLTRFISARNDAQAALDSLRALLSQAAQYPQLRIGAFEAEAQTAASQLALAHNAGAVNAITPGIQHAAVSVQALLNARAAAFSMLSSAQATLATAQSMKAMVGNGASVINGLAAQLRSAGDQATFQSITAQLASERQSLAAAIYAKQLQPVASPGAIAGKLIVVSLSRQALTAYQDGNVVLTTLVATGRPALPTPAGYFHVFAKLTHFYMVSPWPVGSPYWYPNSYINWGLEFIRGGYFIHDAYWRSWYGPGSNLYNGTHGCVNVPYGAMSFLYSWTPIGTPVIVQY